MNVFASGIAAARDIPADGGPLISPLLRLTPPAYADGIAAPREAGPAAERIAFDVFSQGDESIENDLGLSALWIFWGQFIDHDMDLVPEQEGPGAELLKDDPRFPVVRSEAAAGTGENGVPREQPNAVTPLIDASHVYGSDRARETALRTGEGGRLETRPGRDGVDFLPDVGQVLGPDAEVPPAQEGFTAGDVRARENPALTALHTVFLNEHNRWADRFAAEHPAWTDEEIFQNARIAVETLIQKITYEEFLPVLVGDALPGYSGFDPAVDPRIANEFATAAFRFGHTAIPDALTFAAEDGTATAPPLPLFRAFEDDRVIEENGIAALMRGLLEERAQKIDTKVVDSLNFLLFTPDEGITGFSLPERNILRGRDHGLDGYLSVRSQLLDEVFPTVVLTDFSIVSPDPAVQQALAGVYDTVRQVDLWVGGLAEEHVPGTTLGPTFQAIVADQFARTRDGDPFFYLARDWRDEAVFEELMATSLSDVLMRSGGVEHVQAEATLASARKAGGDGGDHVAGAGGRDLLIGFAGRDFLQGRGDDDDLFGDAGRDMLVGGPGGDVLTGGAGTDKLRGGPGDDTLAGGDGHDHLVGGPGADRFVFTAGEEGADTVADFRSGEDLVVIEGFGADFGDVRVVPGPFMTEIFVGGREVAHLMGMGGQLVAEEDVLFIA